MQNNKNKKRLVLLDAHAILHRAYHALPDFTSSSGEPTGALYGLSLMLFKIFEELRPDYVAACYDLPKPTYRHRAYADYKAGRKKTDNELVEQIKSSREIFRAFNVPIYDKEGFEADDILGTIVEKVKNHHEIETVIASGDMDTLQLVRGREVLVYTLRRGIKDTIIYDEPAVKERFGFGPELLPDYKGLRGDPSDNIPGIKGIGEKTATILITQIGSIEDIYKRLKRNRKKFAELGFSERLTKLIEENEEEALFSKELALIRRDAPIKFELPEKNWRQALDTKKAAELFKKLSFRSLIERLNRDFGHKEPVKKARQEKAGETLSQREKKELFIALSLLNSEELNPSEDDILFFSKKRNFREAKGNILDEIKNRGLQKVFSEIEIPLIDIVSEMEKVGIKIDKKYLKILSAEYHRELSKIEKSIWREAGEQFNINSPRQLGEILYGKLKLSVGRIKKTPTGAASTRESELEKMIESHPIIGKILEYRELQKLLSTYIDNIPKMADEDGRLRAGFKQIGAATGRMSSQNPNLQNIPSKTEQGRKIRNAFTAENGYKLVAFDYSQIELRVAAFLSGDKKLLGIFKRGEDIHNAVAMEIYGVPEDGVNKEMRSHAKVVNFGILYGMGVNALSANLGADRKTAQKFYNEYFEKFPGVADFIEKTKTEAREKGRTKTFFGRRRYFPGITSRLPYIRARAERMATNAPIQGTQADIVKKAMIEIDAYLEKEKLRDKARLLLQVHDELVYEIEEEKLGEIVPEIKKIMEGIISPEETKGIIFETDVKIGDNWGEMDRYK